MSLSGSLFLSFFIKGTLVHHAVHPFKTYHSLVVSVLRAVRPSPQPVLLGGVTPKRNAIPFSAHPRSSTPRQRLATTNILSVSVDWPFLRISYKRNCM